jgi:hypothetical protein
VTATGNEKYQVKLVPGQFVLVRGFPLRVLSECVVESNRDNLQGAGLWTHELESKHGKP